MKHQLERVSVTCSLLVLLAGCPSDDGGDGASSMATTGGATASAGTTGDTTPMTSESDGSDDSNEAGSEATTQGGTTADTTAGGSEGEGSSGGRGGGTGCALTCTTPEDCVPPTGGDPSDYACEGGYCTFVGESPACDPTMCDDLGIGVCADVDGASRCTTPCRSNAECIPDTVLQCTGQDDDGNMICEAIPCLGAAEGEPCETPIGAFGTCTEGLCTCSSDAECTAEGYGCNTGA
jgi:hypothetical protein